jgi:hypothetical protein
MMPQEARWIQYACVGGGHSCPPLLLLLLILVCPINPGLSSIAPGGLTADQSGKHDDNPKINFNGGGQECPPHTYIQTTSVLSSTNFLSFSSLPASSNEFVIAALPFSTLVIT